MTKLIVALDWTPNTNHAGFFVAQAQGLYQLQACSMMMMLRIQVLMVVLKQVVVQMIFQ